MGSRTSRPGPGGTDEERADLVRGSPRSLEIPGFRQGAHGAEEVIPPGKPSLYQENAWQPYGGWFWIFLQWPISAVIWGLIYLGQKCSPFWYPWLGPACCYRPSQIPYIHTVYVVADTLKNTFCGIVCCCGWMLDPAAGILIATVYLPTPPRFMFDENQDRPYLLTLAEYTSMKAATFPKFSGRYRAIDGGGNNAEFTFVGQGGRGYSMNEPFAVLSPSVLPDIEPMVRSLEMRTTFLESPFGHNALCTWFANVAIHDFFRSATGNDNKWVGGKDKPWVNLHSGYLDLQVLYGFNAEIAASVRTFHDGKLHKIAENRFDGSRIVESKVIIELLRREHNWVCDQLASRYPGQFPNDESLYQQARLVMGGTYINLILRQYGDQMFGECAPDGRGFAELRRPYGWWPSCAGKHRRTAGNHSTLNFNLIYHWHTALPEEWSADNTPKCETDDEIRQIILNMYNWKAGSFGPDNVPPALFARPLSVPGAAVRNGRLMGGARLNDFRKRLLEPYKDFNHMCGDPEVARRVAAFYPSIEDVELAVGVQVERAMGGGWALGETVGTAIVFDALNSIRQDRFYTDDFRPDIYTPWGYEHAKTTVLVDLLNRHLQLGLNRNIMLGRLPSWRAPDWADISGFTSRGRPIPRKG